MKFKNIFSNNFFNKLGADNIMTMAASLSYYTALSLSPLLVLIITFVSFMGAGFKKELSRQIQDLVGSQAATALEMIIKNADNSESMRSASTIFGFVTLLLSAGGIFEELRGSLNRIFEVTVKNENVYAKNIFFQASVIFLKKRIFNMGMVLTFVFILIISLVISSVLSIWLQGTDLFIGQLINFVISAVIFTVLFSAIYYFMPQRRMRLKPTLLSGFITAILFSIGKSLIGVYLGQSAVASTYGAAGSLIVLLMWVYYSSIVIFISAEISHQLDREAFRDKSL